MFPLMSSKLRYYAQYIDKPIAVRDAIVFSLKALSRSNGRSALVLLTDGIDTVSATEPAALDKAVTDANKLLK